MKNLSQITVIIPTSLVSSLVEFLKGLGVEHLYGSYASSQILDDRNRFKRLLGKSFILNEPSEVLYFYVPHECEVIVMKYVVAMCELNKPGRGSIFSTKVEVIFGDVDNFICQIHEPEQEENLISIKDVKLYQNLSLVTCSINKSEGHDLSNFLLRFGVVPVIANATGTGLRDQLGLLRITIPKDKELISVIVGSEEVSEVMKQMIKVGKINRPGRGFIWSSPIQRGVMNLKTSTQTSANAASIEQMIAAIDSLQGSLAWRQGQGENFSPTDNLKTFSSYEILFQVDEDISSRVRTKVLELGISGATVQRLKTLIEKKSHDHEEVVVNAQEVVRVVVSQKQKQRIVKFLNTELAELDQSGSCFVFTFAKGQAFNHKKPTD